MTFQLSYSRIKLSCFSIALFLRSTWAKEAMVAEKAIPLLPVRCPVGDRISWQKKMSRVAGIERQIPEMEQMLRKIEEALDNAMPVDPSDTNFKERVLLGDILLTQREVLSAMLFDARHGTHEGVLMTKQGKSFRVAARPIPDRDLWFESVWRKYREREGR